MKNLPLYAAVGLLGAGLWLASQPAPAPAPPAHPAPPPAPDPDCPDGKCPPKRPRPKPWGEPASATVGGPKHADGTEIDCDLPGKFHQKNTGGSDGAGLCVFASMRHSGLFADEPCFTGLFDWMKRHPGGGYPEKVDEMVARYCKEKGVPVPKYLQVESADLGILKRACAAGLMPGVTYWRSPTGRYGGQRISHMVSLVAASDKWFVILDNNYPGEDAYEWLTPDEFKKAYTGNTGKGWAVIPLEPGPPPIPHH